MAIDRQPELTNSPDLAILIVAANRVIIDRLLAAQRAQGFRDIRPRHGFVVRAVFSERPTINELAELLDTSKQAASKLADDMVRSGYLERVPDPADRRVARLRLTP